MSSKERSRDGVCGFNIYYCHKKQSTEMIYAVIFLNYYDIIIYKEMSIKLKSMFLHCTTLQLKVSRVWYDLHIDLLDWNETVQVYL